MVTKEDLFFLRECDEKKVLMLELVENLRKRFDYDPLNRTISKENFERIKKSSDKKVERLEHHVAEMIRQNEDRKQGILEEISTLTHVEQDVIRMRYQKGWNWKQIADEIHFSDANIFRIHKKALEHLGAEDV